MNSGKIKLISNQKFPSHRKNSVLPKCNINVRLVETYRASSKRSQATCALSYKSTQFLHSSKKISVIVYLMISTSRISNRFAVDFRVSKREELWHQIPLSPAPKKCQCISYPASFLFCSTPALPIFLPYLSVLVLYINTPLGTYSPSTCDLLTSYVLALFLALCIFLEGKSRLWIWIWSLTSQTKQI